MKKQKINIYNVETEEEIARAKYLINSKIVSLNGLLKYYTEQLQKLEGELIKLNNQYARLLKRYSKKVSGKTVDMENYLNLKGDMFVLADHICAVQKDISISNSQINQIEKELKYAQFDLDYLTKKEEIFNSRGVIIPFKRPA